MRYFALAVFALHALIEMTFGANAFLSGAFSSQSAEEVANQAAHIASAARFLGVALFSIGLLGALTLFVLGVASQAGRWMAGVLAFFHLVGVAGVFVTNASFPGFLSQTNAIGALVIHGLLGLGFVVVVLRHGAIRGRE